MPNKSSEKNNPILKVSKIEAAVRQLKTAIRLFFEKGDEVSIHTLVSAAHKILHDIGKKTNIRSIRDASWVKKEKVKEFLSIISGPENFFKHGSRDKDETFDFRPAITPLYLLEAIALHAKINGSQFNEGILFMVWYHLYNPEMLNFEELKKNPLTANLYKEIAKTDPNDLELFSQVLQSINVKNRTK